MNQKDKFSKLIEILSKKSKDRERILLNNLNTIRIRTLDHKINIHKTLKR